MFPEAPGSHPLRSKEKLLAFEEHPGAKLEAVTVTAQPRKKKLIEGSVCVPLVRFKRIYLAYYTWLTRADRARAGLGVYNNAFLLQLQPAVYTHRSKCLRKRVLNCKEQSVPRAHPLHIVCGSFTWKSACNLGSGALMSNFKHSYKNHYRYNAHLRHRKRSYLLEY